MRLILFGTSGCHLCEQAEDIIIACLDNQSKSAMLESMDISEDDHWNEVYAMRIPVLHHPDSGQELDWPFDHDSVDKFIANAESTTPIPCISDKLDR